MLFLFLRPLRSWEILALFPDPVPLLHRQAIPSRADGTTITETHEVFLPKRFPPRSLTTEHDKSPFKDILRHHSTNRCPFARSINIYMENDGLDIWPVLMEHLARGGDACIRSRGENGLTTQGQGKNVGFERDPHVRGVVINLPTE